MIEPDYRQQIKNLSPKPSLDNITRAISSAEKFHKDQIRFSGEPYVNHSLRIAITLGEMGMDATTMIAGLLHNCISNSPQNEKEISQEIEKEFGQEVLTLINQYNNISKATANTDTEYEIMTKFILNNAKDLRPVLIKLADTLDNVRTIEYMPKERLNTKLQKIIYVYAPLAEYLNLDLIKKELEEKALEIYKPEEYQMIKRKMEENHYTNEMKEKYLQYLKELLKDIPPMPSIYGRVKSIYSVYNKQKKQLKETGKVDISDIKDLIAFRLVTDREEDCFDILEKIMDKGDIITQDFDDYITHPKPNGYKALQGPIVLDEISPSIIEIQILTQDMSYYNTYGPASHIAYKESKSRYANPTDKYSWVEQVHKEINKHISMREQHFSIPINVNIFPNNVFAFTPKGKIFQLNLGDTVVDFAFKVHTNVGYRMVSAKVNGKAEKLDYQIKTGDQIEIITQIGKKTVKQEWIKYANSPSTKSKIQKTWKNT
jgi:GTP pyrophosphokinase